MKNHLTLKAYLEELQKQGRFLFVKQETADALQLSESAMQSSLKRLARQKKVAYLKKGLYQIISLAYEAQGSLPPEWFIHDLMMHLGIPYYVGLLSAAAYHGAAHQAPQIFQVISAQHVPTLQVGDLKICFYASRDFSTIPCQDLKTPAGYMKVSTPEGTAFDLLRYLHASGHLNHIATVLNELAEEIDPEKLVQIMPHLSIRYSQRLGYLLEQLGHINLSDPLHAALEHKPLMYIPLRPDTSIKKSERNTKWHLWINEFIEPDA